jgi:glutaredoxin
MTYELFTYPDCRKCEDLKDFLRGEDLRGQEFDLVQKDSRLKVRDYLALLKRDEKGSLILPILVLKDEAGVKAVLFSREELEAWLRSKA